MTRSADAAVRVQKERAERNHQALQEALTRLLKSKETCGLSATKMAVRLASEASVSVSTAERFLRKIKFSGKALASAPHAQLTVLEEENVRLHRRVKELETQLLQVKAAGKAQQGRYQALKLEVMDLKSRVASCTCKALGQ